MKKWKVTTDDIKLQFVFLKDFGFKIINEKNEGLYSCVTYKNQYRKILIDFEGLDFYFSVDIYKSPDTTYSDDGYETKDILSLLDLIKINDKDFDINRLIPIYKNGLDGELELCAELLQKYGEKILKGEEWY